MKRKKGFTLIEMMIVVAIIALLATIAIPNYINFQLRAKTSEAKANLGAIRTCEEAYRAEEGTYLTCPVNPATVPTGSTRGTWLTTSAMANWEAIGFEPKGLIYYQYAVPSADATTFTAQAISDLDSSGAPNSTFTLNQDGVLGSTTPLE